MLFGAGALAACAEQPLDSGDAAVNAAGEVVGNRLYSKGGGRRVTVLGRCAGSQAIELPPVSGYTDSRATGIDDHGHVVGVSSASTRTGSIGTATLWDISTLPPCS